MVACLVLPGQGMSAASREAGSRECDELRKSERGWDPNCRGARAGERRCVAGVKYTRVHVFLSIAKPAGAGEFCRGFWRGS